MSLAREPAHRRCCSPEPAEWPCRTDPIPANRPNSAGFSSVRVSHVAKSKTFSTRSPLVSEANARRLLSGGGIQQEQIPVATRIAVGNEVSASTSQRGNCASGTRHGYDLYVQREHDSCVRRGRRYGVLFVMDKRLDKRHKRQVARAKLHAKRSEPDMRTREQIEAAREASRPDAARGPLARFARTVRSKLTSSKESDEKAEN
jgi:hypothetical protein